MKFKMLLLVAIVSFATLGFVSDSTPAPNENIELSVSSDDNATFQSVPQNSINIERKTNEAVFMAYTVESVYPFEPIYKTLVGVNKSIESVPIRTNKRGFRPC